MLYLLIQQDILNILQQLLIDLLIHILNDLSKVWVRMKVKIMVRASYQEISPLLDDSDQALCIPHDPESEVPKMYSF